jgi:hypothetical protein
MKIGFERRKGEIFILGKFAESTLSGTEIAVESRGPWESRGKDGELETPHNRSCRDLFFVVSLGRRWLNQGINPWAKP